MDLLLLLPSPRLMFSSSSASVLMLSTSHQYHCVLSTKKALAAASSSPVSRLHLKANDLHSMSLNGLCLFTPITTIRRAAVAVKASSDIKGTGPDGGDSLSESDDEEDVLLDKLPLDSKLQQKLEHKMRMKLAKNIRLSRKKLVRKSRMRKKGQWPPSKVNKLKNV